MFIISDVHGCYHTLMKLIEKLPKDAELIFVGDLVDKGLHSKNVIEFVINNNHRCILGNHEYYMQLNIENALYKNIESNWSTDPERYGGAQTLDNYIKDDSLLKKHLEWIDNLPAFLEIDNYLISHGFGLPYYMRRNTEAAQKIMRTNRINDSKYKDDWEDFSKYSIINIFGHCHFEEVQIDRNEKFYGIDTGCAYGNKLTAFELNTHKILQVETDKKDLHPFFIDNDESEFLNS